MKKPRIKLWHKIALVMTIIFLVCLSLLAFIFILLVRHYNVQYRLLPFILLTLASAILACLVATLFSNILLRPIDVITDGLRRVASGDFTVHLNEDSSMNNVRQMNSNFNKMVRELNSTEMLKSDFISNVSHEFKTPLAAIEGYTTLLSATDLTEEQKNYTENISRSVSRLSTLTGNILRLSKLENQQFHQEKTRFSLDEQIRQAILFLESSWSAKDLNIEPELDPVSFTGYEDLLPQVWINLMTNAIKFTPKCGTIQFTLQRTKGGVTAVISDNGIGMTEDEQAHAFDKFYQADNNHSVAGNGLGLPLVRQIVLMHDGTIQLKSAPNEGSTFTIFLPDETN